jgi:hypothetical protein
MVECWNNGMVEHWNGGMVEKGKWRLEMGRSVIGYSLVDVGYPVFWIFNHKLVMIKLQVVMLRMVVIKIIFYYIDL